MKFSITSFIYRQVIDPILSGVQQRILDQLDARDSVLDVACGTGSLSISMSGYSGQVLGIDLSEEMIAIARSEAGKKNISNIDFEIRDASDLSKFTDNEFSIAVSSMAIHQFDSNLAIQILKEMKRISSLVIVMDYFYPIPQGISRYVIYMIEWIAGGDHYRNFRKFNKLGGLSYFASKAGLNAKAKLYTSNAFVVRAFS